MFLHNFKYRIKCIVKDKQMMFWTLLFPIILATLFNLAFSNISSAEKFTKIKIGIVKDSDYNNNKDFVEFLESASNHKKDDHENKLFDIKYGSRLEAERLLEDGKVEGYIYFENGTKLVVKKSGIYQTIIKSVIDDYTQSISTIGTISKYSNGADKNILRESISNRVDYMKEVSTSRSAPNTTVNYFYTLIAMTCFYGGFLGLKEVTSIQANQSTQGARINVAPTHKLKMFFGSMLAATVIQIIDIILLLIYLMFILKVDFGNQVLFVLLTCIIGSITGVSFGTFIASIVKKGEGIKVGILIGFSMTMSFLSGLMYDKMKYIVNENAPILSYLNPVNLITDAFYSLYYYSDHKQYFIDISVLCLFPVVFSIITYFVLRRQRYANI